MPHTALSVYSFHLPSFFEDTTSIPILQMKTLSLREAKGLPRKRQGQDLSSGLSGSSKCSVPLCFSHAFIPSQKASTIDDFVY